MSTRTHNVPKVSIAALAIALAATTALIPTEASAFALGGFGGHGLGGGMPSLGHSMAMPSIGHVMPALGRGMPAIGHAMPSLAHGINGVEPHIVNVAHPNGNVLGHVGQTPSIEKGHLAVPGRSNLQQTSPIGKTDHQGSLSNVANSSVLPKSVTNAKPAQMNDTRIGRNDNSVKSDAPVVQTIKSDPPVVQTVKSDVPVVQKVDRMDDDGPGDWPYGPPFGGLMTFHDLLGGAREMIIDTGDNTSIHIWCRNDGQTGIVCRDWNTGFAVSLIEDANGNLHPPKPPKKKATKPSFISLYDPEKNQTTTRTFNTDGTHTDVVEEGNTLANH
jgi:hypothetical protein